MSRPFFFSTCYEDLPQKQKTAERFSRSAAGELPKTHRLWRLSEPGRPQLAASRRMRATFCHPAPSASPKGPQPPQAVTTRSNTVKWK